MSRTITSVNGLAFIPINESQFQHQGQVRGLLRFATSVEFSPFVPRTEQFLVSVPTLHLLNGYFMRLSEVSLLFNAFSATIDAITITQGQSTTDGFQLSWTGIHPTKDSSNTLTLPRRAVSGPIGVELTVSFAPLSGTQPPRTAGWIQFVSLVVQYETEDSLFDRIIRRLASFFTGRS
jgi:hypothetical protein